MKDNLCKTKPEPDKDHSDSLSGFLRPTPTQSSNDQTAVLCSKTFVGHYCAAYKSNRVYSVAWIPYLVGRDLAGEVSNDSV